jgi:hypothetical protein
MQKYFHSNREKKNNNNICCKGISMVAKAYLHKALKRGEGC